MFFLKDKKRIDAKNSLNSTLKQKAKKNIFAYLSINLIGNKFELLFYQIKGNVGISMTSETKIDDSLPVGNFQIDGFSSPYRFRL